MKIIKINDKKIIDLKEKIEELKELNIEIQSENDILKTYNFD